MPLSPEDQLDWQENQHRSARNRWLVDLGIVALTLLAVGLLVALILVIRKAHH